MDRKVLFALGLAASLALTALLWAVGFPGFFLFLVLPFLWFPMGRRAKRTALTCPACGAEVRLGFAFCPTCGGRL